MSDVQWFAFVILPIAISVLGWAWVLLAERWLTRPHGVNRAKHKAAGE